MRLRNLTILVLLPVLVGSWQPATAQPDSLDSATVEVSHEVFAGDKAPQEAHRTAVERAQAEAVRKAIGTQVRAERRVSSLEAEEEVVEHFSEVVRSSASGRVVDYEVLDEGPVSRGGNPFYRVRIRATVRPARGRSDPGFQVGLRLNEADRTYVARSSLEESDEVVAEIESSQDAHITLFNVTPDTVQVIWPNAISEDTFVPAETAVQFPPPDLRARGLRLRAKVPDGKSQVSERLVAVATKQEVPFQEVPDLYVEQGQLTTTQTSIQHLNRWLVDIPLDQRDVASVSYDVLKAGGE